MPSFSICRHVSAGEAESLSTMRRAIRDALHDNRYLSSNIKLSAPEDLTIKVLDQNNLIQQFRDHNIHPDSVAMRTLAFDIRDELNDFLGRAPRNLSVPLGKLSLFGADDSKRALGIHIDGWRGHEANYGAKGPDGGELLPNYVLASEGNIAIASIVDRFSDFGLEPADLRGQPHVTLARNEAGIKPSQLENLKLLLGEVIPEQITFADPVIYFRGSKDEATEVINIAHSWSSLSAVS